MVHSFKVSTTLSAYRVVSMLTGTSYTVQYPPAAGAIPIGVTIDTVKDTTSGIPVACAGERAYLYFNDSVTSGCMVKSDTSGRGTLWTVAPDTTTSLTVSSAYIGQLLGPKVDLTGTIAEILIMPGIAKAT